MRPSPASSTRAPTPLRNASSQIGANMTRSWAMRWIWWRIVSRFLRSTSRACCALHQTAADLLLAPLAQEGDPLDRPEAGLDAHRLEIVGHRLGHVGVGGVAREVAGVEPVGVPGLG